MSELTLLSDFSLDTTSLSNIYIDEYMSDNNESQIKIYLYLLRNLSKGASVSVITIADTFNYSVTDVERALLYMEKQGLMGLKIENGNIVGLRLLPLKKKRTESFRDTLQIENFRLVEKEESVVESENKVAETVTEINKPEYSAAQVAEFTKRPEIQELLFVVQAYTGKPATMADIKTIMFISEELSFSTEMIDYLVENCVENGKKSFRYMEKVARTWYENGIDSVETAKASTKDAPKEVYDVFNAFSIKAGNRKPSLKEIGFVKKWTGDFAFTMDIIKKACEITLNNTHSTSFEYADAVLTDWHSKGVKHLSDAEALINKKAVEKKDVTKRTNKSSSAFNNFSGRELDFAQLEKELWSN